MKVPSVGATGTGLGEGEAGALGEGEGDGLVEAGAGELGASRTTLPEILPIVVFLVQPVARFKKQRFFAGM